MPWLPVDGRSVYYEEQGAGVPLLFLSGMGGDHRAFSVTLRKFSGQYRAMTLDHRDCGRTDSSTEPYRTDDLARDVRNWMESVGIGPAHVVGHSLGGLIAQELAIRHPESVRSLVLTSTHAGASLWRKGVIDSWVVARQKATPGEFSRITMPWLVGPAFYELPGQVDGLVRFAERNEWPQTVSGFERQAHAVANHDARGRLGLIRVPTLVISGEYDLVNPPEVARELAAGIAGARLQILPGVGHLPHIEAGPAFREAIGEFLASFA